MIRLSSAVKVKNILAEFYEQQASETALQPEERFGNYVLQEKIGEGAFGTVWKATQTKPLKREVALKILKAGMDTEEILTRFEQERQVLAVMNHPHVNRVFDAGMTEQERPYFVMELVPDGVPLTDYCRAQNLDLAQRLALFCAVCSGVQHAHEKGIIHRDLKPSNLLVPKDEEGSVKIIDFGIAKAVTEQSFTEVSLLTRVDRLMGTPAYMSPEQSQGGGGVDTRSDVYSLGVILYELLTDILPFENGFNEQSPPPKNPSEFQRATFPIARDLDWIALKCLEEEPERRYHSPFEISADLERFLNHEVVLARPPKMSYLLSRFYRRHRAPVLGVIAFAGAILLGLITSFTLFFKEKQARQQAEIETEKSRQISWFLSETLSSAGVSKSLGRDAAMMEDLLQEALVRIEADENIESEVEIEIRRIIGNTLLDLDDYPSATTQFERVLTLVQQEAPEQSLRQAQARYDLADALEADGNISLAKAQLEQILTIIPTDSPNPKASSLYWKTQVVLAWIYQEEGSLERAESLAKRCYQGWEKDPQQHSLAEIPTVYGSILREQERYQEAAEVYRAELQHLNQQHPSPHPQRVKSLTHLGATLFAVEEAEEAMTVLQKSLVEGRILFGEKNPHADQALVTLANMAQAQGQREQALEYLEQAVVSAEATFGPKDSTTINLKKRLQRTRQ